MEKKQALRLFASIMIASTVAFIWGHSLSTSDASSTESEKVLEAVKPILQIFVGKDGVTSHFVRKLAHFTEFSALGFECGLICISSVKLKLQNILYSLFACLATAVTDESIQLLGDRGPSVSDILLDFSGSVLFLLITCGIYFIVEYIRSKDEK